MKTIRILTDDNAFAESLSEAIRKQGNLKWLPHIRQGNFALELLLRDAPDVLVVDLDLPREDGVDVISIANSRIPFKKKPIFIALASQQSIDRTKYIRDEIANCFLKPIDGDDLAAKVWIQCRLQSDEDRRAPVTPRTIQKAVSECLIGLGIYPHLAGYVYLRDGIKMLASFSDLTEVSIGKHIYGGLAKRYNTKPASVEYAMRSAIRRALPKVDSDILNGYFGKYYDVERKRISNSRFMILIAARIKYSLT